MVKRCSAGRLLLNREASVMSSQVVASKFDHFCSCEACRRNTAASAAPDKRVFS